MQLKNVSVKTMGIDLTVSHNLFGRNNNYRSVSFEENYGKMLPIIYFSAVSATRGAVKKCTCVSVKKRWKPTYR